MNQRVQVSGKNGLVCVVLEKKTAADKKADCSKISTSFGNYSLKDNRIQSCFAMRVNAFKLLSAHATPLNNNAYQFDGGRLNQSDSVTRDSWNRPLTKISSSNWSEQRFRC
jgi:hypothetical protein